MSGSTCQRGFSLLEIAVVLAAIGVLTTMSLAVYRPVSMELAGSRQQSILMGIDRALLKFALQHHRLPCPDTNGNGLEGGATPGCSGSASTGGVPYATLGLAQSGAPGADSGLRDVVYGVFRDAGILADLVVPTERTDQAVGAFGYLDRGDLRRGLAYARSAPVSTTRIHMTGDAAASGAESCGTNPVAHAAWILASAGPGDADGDGNRFDGVNANLSRTGSGAMCFAAPGRRADASYDDRVLARSFDELLGALAGVN